MAVGSGSRSTIQMAVWRDAMAKDIIRYDLLVQDAMRGVMRKVLGDVAESGYLPGDHHFTISFRTDAPGVTISRRLAEQWPSELTIILQHQYSDLEVDEEGFGVTLSFRSVAEHLYVPFSAVTGFFDPAVEFGLRFESAEDALEDSEEEDAPSARTKPCRENAGAGEGVQAGQGRAGKIEPAKAEPNKTPSADRQRKLKPVEAKEDGDDKIVSIDAFRKKP